MAMRGGTVTMTDEDDDEALRKAKLLVRMAVWIMLRDNILEATHSDAR